MNPIEFQGKSYTPESLKSMSTDALLELRNLVASNLGAPRVAGFKDQAAAESATWKALQKYEEEMNDETNTAVTGDAGEKPKAEKPKAERPTPKCYSSEIVKRPTRRMFMRIKKVGAPDKSQRPFAWDSFTDGMRLVDIKEDENLHAGKITFWMRQDPPLIELVDISDEQFETELQAWYDKHGLKNPEAEKAAKKAEREKAKADRAAEREAKKKAKAEEAEKKKAEREAKKKADAEAKAAEKEAKAKAKAEAKAEADAKPAPAAGKAAPAAARG